MATKLQYYKFLSEQTISELTKRQGNWLRFLDTAARMYKMSFPEQALLYAQRPNAIAVAPIELWNETFDRWVRRGSKGIALIDDTGMYPKLKYVFDVVDTEPSRYNTRPVRLWELRQEHKTPVLAELAKAYEDIDLNGTLSEAFRNIADQLATEYYDDNRTDIRYRAENSFLESQGVYDFSGSIIEDADDGVMEQAFTEALSKSIAYAIMSRCGLDIENEFDDEDFQVITDFNTPDMIYALGTATGELSKQVLRDIELTIRKYERVKVAQMAQTTERSDENYDRNPYLQPSRGLSSAEPKPERTAAGVERTAGTLRKDEESLPQRTPDNQLQPSFNDGEALSPSKGDRAGGEPETGNGDGAANRENDPPRQDERPDGVDSGDEQPESPSGGNGDKRIDLQLSPPIRQEDEIVHEPSAQTSDFSQVGKSSIEEILSTSAVTASEVDSILRDGGNSENSTLRIAAHFAKGLPDNGEFLKQEYLGGKWRHKPTETGKGFDFKNRHNVAAWYSDEGITLAIGTTAKNNLHRVTIPWDVAAKRIEALMSEGNYISADRYDEALDNERLELASGLWFFYRDDMRFIPEEWKAEKCGYPEDVALIKAQLDDPDERQAVLDRLEADVNQFNYDIHDRIWHNPDHLLADMKKVMLPPVIRPGNYHENKDFTHYITQDEIDAYLSRGSHFSEGKFRIFSTFLRSTSDKERVDFLKNEYGTGGGTWSEGNGWSDCSPSKGITLRRKGTKDDPEAKVNLSWNAVMRRIETLIGEGQYVNQKEYDYLHNYERLVLAREIERFYYDLPVEYERPFAEITRSLGNENRDGDGAVKLDFYYPEQAEWNAITELLDNPERRSKVHGQMQYIFENTSAQDRYYNVRKATMAHLDDYIKGTYTLFPGLERLPLPGTVTAKLVTPSIAVSKTPHNEPTHLPDGLVEDMRESTFGGSGWNEPIVSGVQLTLFNLARPMPSVDEQREKIEQSLKQEAAEVEAASLLEQNERDKTLLDISNENKLRIVEVFTANPRSREATKLFREIYGVDLALPIAASMKRIGELVAEGKFNLPTGERIISFRRLGDFYEVTGNAAREVATALDLTLTQRNDEQLLGVPAHTIESYTAKLKDLGYTVQTEEPVAEYAVGDKLSYNGKPHQIEKIDDSFVHLQNLGTPSRYAILDHIAVSRDSFERSLLIGELSIEQPQVSMPESEQLPGGDLDTSQSQESTPEPESEPVQSDEHGTMQSPEIIQQSEQSQGGKNGTAQPSESTSQSEQVQSGKRPYTVGDTVWLENRAFRIDSIGDYYKQPDDLDRKFGSFGRSISLWDVELSKVYPITRSMYQGAFEYQLSMDERNAHLAPLSGERELEQSIEVVDSTLSENAEQEDNLDKDKRNEINAEFHLVESDTRADELADTNLDVATDTETDAKLEATSNPKPNGERDEALNAESTAENSAVSTEPIELDFDSVAKTVLSRVMADDDYAKSLQSAPSRTSLRNPCTWALEQSIRDHQDDEPKVYRLYFSEDDFNDNLFNYVLRQSFERRGELTAKNNEPVLSDTPIAEIGESPTTETTEPLIEEISVQPSTEMAAPQFSEMIDSPFIEVTDPEGLAELERLFPSQPKMESESPFIESERSTTGSESQIAGSESPITGSESPITGAESSITALESSIIEPEIPQTDSVSTKSKLSLPPNFHITDDHLGEGGAKTKFRNNILALQTLKSIESEERYPTPDEQEILSRYIGWGGLPQAFDPDNKQWESEYQELSSLLTPEEYESARASTLNAHYTSPTIIKAIWETIARIGFKSGNILEPSMGVGNFFGLIPNALGKSKLYGVELDSITARIAKQLYPHANIQETGFERTQFSDAFFDLTIGNVPFGNYKVVDKRYDKHDFSIHNYFFAKSLDMVRPGGIVAFITSKYTMDEKNPKVRKYLAERAELLGAVRLPNTAFLKNAGTETTMDILFLQKRDRPLDIEPEWVHLGFAADGIPCNRYFLDNPETVCGVMGFDAHMNNKYGREDYTACLPIEGADLTEQLKTAMSYVEGTYTVEQLEDLDGVDNHAIPADSSVKNFSYALVTPATEPDNIDGRIYAAEIGKGQVYFRENSLMYPVDLPAMQLERIKGMIALRDCVHRLIALQLDDYSDDLIKAQQSELNDLYDSFIAEFGLINSQANNRAFNADSSYYLLCSLEILDEDGNLSRKADMFTKRTIKQKTVVTQVDTASEALALSLGERACVDMTYMSDLTGKDEETLFHELHGVIFADYHMDVYSNNIKHVEVHSTIYRTADEFLSGNVREKLRKYAEALEVLTPESPYYAVIKENVEALSIAQPKDLDASEISVRLGSTWIPPKYIEQFMYELLNTSWRNKSIYQVKFHEFTGEWQVTGKGRAQYSDINATVTFGTGRMNAYQILDDTLNLRDVRVYDYKEDADGKQIRVLNKKETTLAQQKQEQIKQSFKDWIWKDPVRRQTLVKLYNDRFNSIRPREYDGSHLVFSGISPEISLKPHQLNAVAHTIYGGNTLLAHVVGAGKTFEMIAAAMEMKRLGLCNKSLFAVPNHLTEQWAGEFLRLYPSANILVATKKDFEIRNRKKFCAKIATGDYDAVVIGHSQLEKIPMSRERQERLLSEQLYEIEEGIRELKESNGERFSIKQLEKTKKNLETRLKKLLDAKQKDDVVTFEQLGVDRLFVDEAHNFKNLFLYTKMRNVAGLSTSEAQKSSDLFMKCRYMDELTDRKGIIFATGTPISNSITEMYTMQRYLQYDKLQAMNLTHFDSWASTFGETTTSIELAPEGTGYRARTRFARFHNLPELMSLFKDVADIQTADMLDLPVPIAKYETVIVEPSELQKEMVQELSERAAAVHNKQVDPTEDNMLKITTDGRKIGLDQRLINPLLQDFEGSKVNACTENVYQIWSETSDKKLTQLVFCDFSTPNKDGRFNVYDDIKAKLIERGIPEDEIAFIHDADTEVRKKELFAKVRQGKVRVLFGSTFKLGAGTNVQDKLVAIHDADCPWRPADLEQRAGRIIRQGNSNPEVKIFRYATSGTFDSYLWQTVESKQKFISQIMSSKSPVRSCEDVDETALSYAEIKALCAGNPHIREKMELDVEVAKLRLLKAEHQSQHYRLEDSLLKKFPEQITAITARIAGIEKDIERYNVERGKCVDVQTTVTGNASVSTKFIGMTIKDTFYEEKEPAAKALLDACKGVTDKTDKPVGEYMGFTLTIRYDSFSQQMQLLLRGAMTYITDLGTDAFGNITRINNALDKLPERLEGAKAQLTDVNRQVEAAKLELENPFSQEAELQEKSARLALLNADLNIDGDGGFDVENDAQEKNESEHGNAEDGRDSDDDLEGDDEPDGNDYRYSNDAPRTGTYGKTKPSILDGIRNFDSGRFNNTMKPPSDQRGVANRE